MTNPHCECEMAGYCRRHQMQKGPERFLRCKGESSAADCGAKDWVAWENGKSGATAPANPVLKPEGFCESRGASPKKAQPRPQHRTAGAVDLAERIPSHFFRTALPYIQYRPGVSIEQQKLYLDAIGTSRPEPRPFKAKPTINLVYHFWPNADYWLWHVERVKDLIARCDGRVIIGICTDSHTAKAGDVVDAIGCSRAEYIFTENIANTGNILARGKPYGELLTTIPAMKMLADTGDSVTVYAHAKGAQGRTAKSQAVRLWTEMMYETVSFNLEQTIQKMELGYSCVGSFRTFARQPLNAKYHWHYSGSFYNFRTKDFFVAGFPKRYQLRYGGTEAWPGDHVSGSRSYCMFEDNAPMLRQYDQQAMLDLIGQHLTWQSEQWPEVPMEQHFREFEWLVNKLKDCRSLLVIGSRHGGMEHHLRKRNPGLRIVSVDIDPLPDNTSDCLIRGSSHDESIQGQIRQLGPYDAVFIDGDHTEEGAEKDWIFAKSLNVRQIFFHDFTDAPYHAMCGCFVDRLWLRVLEEAKQSGWTTDEKVVGCGWGGISEVRLR